MTYIVSSGALNSTPTNHLYYVLYLCYDLGLINPVTIINITAHMQKVNTQYTSLASQVSSS